MRTFHGNDAVEDARRRQRTWHRNRLKSDNDIAPIPSIVDRDRRLATVRDLKAFCETYGANVFTLNWSHIHDDAIQRLETAVLDGGMFALAMPRGSGKTSLCEWAALWAVLHGHCPFVALLGASEPKAEERLSSLKIELNTNQVLMEDFPEVCYPVWVVESSWPRFKSQTHLGQPTSIEWTKNKLVLPTVEGSAASGSILMVRGITGEIRGMLHKRQDGTQIRPSLAICDDPQTRSSAKSETQSKTRADTLAADVAYLAGPTTPISVIVPCTVIYQGDMADRILDRDLHPQYRGVRRQMVEKFPKNTDLWDEYAQIWQDSLRNDGDLGPATAFYDSNRAKMDDGAVVSWPERFMPGELSAIQHAMNLKIRDESAFQSEMQNEPIEAFDDQGISCLPADVMAKKTGYPRYMCLGDAKTITGMIDVQGNALYYALCCWSEGFGGHLIDYGVWPDQRHGHRNFGLQVLNNTIERELGGKEEHHMYEAIKSLCKRIVNIAYPVDGGGELRIGRLLIDANWGEMRNTVYQFCREHILGVQIDPSHGKFVGASTNPWSEWKRKRNEVVGAHWRYRPTEDWPIKHVLVDTNYWKSFIHRRMKSDMGAKGTFTLYGKKVDGKLLDATHHIDFADQFCAEYAVETTAKGRKVDEWKMRAGSQDNHLLDCMVGAAVAASMEGIELADAKAPKRQQRKPKRSLKARMK